MDDGIKRKSIVGTPRWVKMFGIIVAILVLLFVVLHLTDNNLGGSDMHLPHKTGQGVQQP